LALKHKLHAYRGSPQAALHGRTEETGGVGRLDRGELLSLLFSECALARLQMKLNGRVWGSAVGIRRRTEDKRGSKGGAMSR